MSRLTPDQVLATPAGELAALQSDALFQLKIDATDLLSAAKAIVEHIDRALELKYADRAQTLRLATGKDTGVVHFDDGHVRITADLAKRVEWDQQRLADIVREADYWAGIAKRKTTAREDVAYVFGSTAAPEMVLTVDKAVLSRG